MHKRERSLPHGLRRRIYSFGVGTVLTIAAAGVLLGLVFLQNAWSNQKLLWQLREIGQLKTDVSKMSESMQNYILAGEGSSAECIAVWTLLSDDIQSLETRSSCSSALLIRDLQDYQDNTGQDFFTLLCRSASMNVTSFYRQFMTQQDDRLFLCNLLQNDLIEQMTAQYPTAVKSNVFYLTLYGIMLLCLLTFTALFSFSFADDIYRPVQKLVDQAGEMMVGNYQLEDLPVLQQDEIGYLTGAFNEMKSRVRANFQDQEELRRLECLLHNAELRALQSQVNPHFLFNVLSVAAEAALTENADHTVDVIENISYMLHYSLTSVRDNTLLCDELKMVRAYLFLQKKRFGNRIRFELNEPEILPALRIPGMTLQPIVENAVMHGTEKMAAGGLIQITVKSVPGAVEICVQDNGCGMTEGMVEALNRGDSLHGTSRSTGLGISNVRSRLKIFYHRENLLQVESKAGQGTCVHLRYLMGEEADHVSDPNCG